jgi:hypothetical protein
MIHGDEINQIKSDQMPHNYSAVNSPSLDRQIWKFSCKGTFTLVDSSCIPIEQLAKSSAVSVNIPFLLQLNWNGCWLIISKHSFSFQFWSCSWSHVIDQCKHALSEMFHSSRVECFTWLSFLGCSWEEGWVFVLRFYSWGSLQPNSVAVTAVFILVVLHNEHTVMIVCNSFSSPLSLCLTHCMMDFLKCAHIISWFVFSSFVTVIFFFSWMIFYYIKLIVLLQWCLLKWNIFV